MFSLLGNTLTNNTVEAAAVQQTAIGVYSCRDVLYQHRVKTSNNARQSPVIDGSVVSGSIDINIDTFRFCYTLAHTCVLQTRVRRRSIDRTITVLQAVIDLSSSVAGLLSCSKLDRSTSSTFQFYRRRSGSLSLLPCDLEVVIDSQSSRSARVLSVRGNYVQLFGHCSITKPPKL